MSTLPPLRFPFSDPEPPACEPFPARELLLAVLLMGGAVGTAAAATQAPQPLDEIRSTAIQAMGASDAQAEAVLDPTLRLARCSQALEGSASGPKTAQVRCPDQPGWKLHVPVRIRREADVVVLNTAARSGVPIAANQLAVQRRDVTGVEGAPFSDPTAVVGRIPSRPLAPGDVPTETDLALGNPLKRGDPVVLVAKAGGIEVRMPGRALGASQQGGQVGVENTSSHRVLRGRVIGEGLVEILP